jgi:hypothetical protein
MSARSGGRRLGDGEIALIKAMLKTGMSKTKIQAYFTHPDNPVNFGRITNIDDGDYGRDIAEASSEELSAFISGWTRSRGGSVAAVVQEAVDLSGLSRVDPRRVQPLFERAADGLWALRGLESDEVECKKTLRLDGKVLRAVAAFSNRRGGYIFFGVDDEDGVVAGISEEQESAFDVSRATQSIRAALEPMPGFEFQFVQLGAVRIGALFIHHEPSGPVIASKDEQSLREGTIYYRYPGESRAIRPAEFRKLLEERDRRARLEARHSIDKILDLGGRAAVVSVADLPSTGSDRIIREGIDEADVLRNFVRNERVQHPAMYIAKSCHTPKRWLPIFFYAQQANLTKDQLYQLIESRDTNHVATKRAVLQRVVGQQTAYARPGTRSSEILSELKRGVIPVPAEVHYAAQIANAIIGLEEVGPPVSTLLPLLRACIECVRDDRTAKPALWSSMYKAAARLDELYFDLSHQA